MSDAISPLSSGQSNFEAQGSGSNYYSSDLSEMKTAFMEECQYLIIDPNQLLGMTQSFHGFLEYGDDYFNNAFQSIEPHIRDYCEKKNEDPAFKLTPIMKNQISEGAQQFNNIDLSLTPDQFTKGVYKTVTNVLHQLEKEEKSPQLLAKLTGVISNLCNLDTFSSDQGMNNLFFDLSTYTMGEMEAISIPYLTESVQSVLDSL